MLTPTFVANCVLQLTDQSVLDWFVDNIDGGYFTVIDGWTIRLKGDHYFAQLSYQKSPKLEHIVARSKRRFSNNQDSELFITLQSLLESVKERIYKDKTIEEMLADQEQKIRKEFCGSMLGWNK